jgi:hypothetical protein
VANKPKKFSKFKKFEDIENMHCIWHHQVRLKEEDHSKTSFITSFGTYCYKTMSFGLKNTGATYQRAIQTCLSEQIGDNAEAYVDDVMVKTKNPNMVVQE